LSRIESGEEPLSLEDGLPDAQLFSVKMVDNYFEDSVEFLATGMVLSHYTVEKKKHLVVRDVDYHLIAGQLYKLGPDEIPHICITKHERDMILEEAHVGIVEGHYAGKATAHDILRVGLWWPTLHKDTEEYCKACDVLDNR